MPAHIAICTPLCWTCSAPLPDDQWEGWCSDVCRRTLPVFRWTCSRCGRFVAEQNICERNVPDPGSYYGADVETHHHCSRCGFVDDEPGMVQVGTVVLDPADAVGIG